MVGATESQPGALIRPVWRRLRFWIGVGLIAVVGGILLALVAPAPGAPLDPSSARKNGSKALAALLAHYGTTVERTTSIQQSHGAVLVAFPNDYSVEQLQELASRASRLILIDPDDDVVQRIAPAINETDVAHSGRVSPQCSWPGAGAAGTVDFPDDATLYDGAGTSCYGGAVLISPRVTVLGSSGLLRNDNLAHDGVAALDINAISDDRATRHIMWLMPGADVRPASGNSIWTLFPSGAYRVFWWTIAVGVLLVLWRGRRLGPVVSEPLPLLVRAAEVVEGHGRLYRRAGARDRAAAALRAATSARLATRYGLPKRSTRADIAAAVATHTNRDAVTVTRLLTDAAPADDSALLRLAAELEELDVAATRPREQRGQRT